eukprot:CAMPEP_0116882736 /NCGR_PEP_ID=MMETSP0463-20121206/15098_1 /TAXON_ID=181622 /ORGANISM="Strombidinopsis sp, Strain SopsisLIS2011" /LENGTH=41 /DNA_ID= /DNA_START= /DNA_END= /DNA_ORIENTATION=
MNEGEDEAYYIIVTFGAESTTGLIGSSDNVGSNYLALVDQT